MLKTLDIRLITKIWGQWGGDDVVTLIVSRKLSRETFRHREENQGKQADPANWRDRSEAENRRRLEFIGTLEYQRKLWNHVEVSPWFIQMSTDQYTNSIRKL